MTWARPEALWLLALAIPVIILHLQVQRRVRWVVPSMVAFDAVFPAAAAPKAAGLRLRDYRGLLLELAALTCLSLAMAGPEPGREMDPERPLVIVLDGTASTAAAGRFDEMRSLARESLHRVGTSTPVTLILAAERPYVLAGGAEGRDAVLDALARVRPRLVGGSTVRDAVTLASSVEGAEVLVLTDGCGDDVLVAGEDVSVVTVGRPESNAAVLEATVHRDGDGPAVALVRSRSEDGTESSRRVELPAAGGPASIPAGDGEDALAADDTLRVLLPGARGLAVEVLTADGSVDPYLAAALSAMGRTIDGDRSRVDGAAGSGRPDVRILLGAADPGNAPALVLDAGSGLKRSAPLVRAGETSHPVLSGVDVAEWIVTLGRALPLRSGDAVLLEGPEGPLALARITGERRMILLGFDPSLSTLPMSASWPVFVRNAVRWLAAGGDAALPAVVASGSRLDVRVPPVASVFVGVAAGHAGAVDRASIRRVPARGGAATLEVPVPAVGADSWLVLLDGPGASAREWGRASIALLDAAESDLVPSTLRNADSVVLPVRDPRAPPPRSRAPWLALA
ncbi:MAG: vWA domain-containing protein, partial [Planctomycetota bacterium]